MFVLKMAKDVGDNMEVTLYQTSKPQSAHKTYKNFILSIYC